MTLLSIDTLSIHVTLTDNLHYQMVIPQYKFDSLMRSWFLRLRNGSIIVTITVIGSTMLDTARSSSLNLRIHTTFLAALEATMYSASVVEFAIISC